MSALGTKHPDRRTGRRRRQHVVLSCGKQPGA
nr:MAG TPA: hypothetical protein [Caudoviricetes sp.]